MLKKEEIGKLLKILRLVGDRGELIVPIYINSAKFFFLAIVDVFLIIVISKYVDAETGGRIEIDHNAAEVQHLNSLFLTLGTLYTGLTLSAAVLIRSLIGIKFLSDIIKYSQKIQIRLRTYIFSKCCELWPKSNPNDLADVIGRQVSQFSDVLIFGLMRAAADIIIILAITIFLFVKEPALMLVVTMLLTPIVIIYAKLLLPKIKRAGGSVAARMKGLHDRVNEVKLSIAEIKILNRINHLKNEVEGLSNIIGREQHLNIISQYLPRYMIEAIIYITIVAIVTYISVANAGDQATNSASLLFLASVRLLPMINGLLSTASKIQYAFGTVSKLESYVDSGDEINKDELDIKVRKDLVIKIINGGAKCQQQKTQKITNNSQIVMATNNIYFIVGRSGAGKTSLVRSLMGAEDYYKLGLSIEGRLVSSILESHLKVGYMPQVGTLFLGSLKENIIIDEGINESAYYALLEELKIGYLNNRVADENSLLSFSGGERQKILCIRYLINKFDILILDEPTSGMDSDSIEAFYRLLRKKVREEGGLVILITHQTEHIEATDKVLEF